VLSPATIKQRRNNSDKILNDTGRLKGSFAHVATNSHVEITTDVEYAAMMNFGGTKAQFPNLWGDIPARPFFPSENLPLEWESDVMNVLNNFLAV
jgi:phage gpG-like protein